MTNVRHPKGSRPRDRRVSEEEIERLKLCAGYENGVPVSVMQRVLLAFLFAIETGMRAGEICSLEWRHVNLKNRTAFFADDEEWNQQNGSFIP